LAAFAPLRWSRCRGIDEVDMSARDSRNPSPNPANVRRITGSDLGQARKVF